MPSMDYAVDLTLVDALARSQAGKPKLTPLPPKSKKLGRLFQSLGDLLGTSQENVRCTMYLKVNSAVHIVIYGYINHMG
jgi:hypothetical protein